MNPTELKVKLGNGELIILPSFEKISKLEQELGSIFTLSYELQMAKTKLIDVVSLYYILQHKTSYSKEEISEKIMQDGAGEHYCQVKELMGNILSGSGEKTEKKQ